MQAEHLHQEIAERDRKRRVLERSVVDKDSVGARQLAWLSKDAGAHQAAYRPIKLYRTAAKKWILALDCQIRTSTDKNGLSRRQRRAVAMPMVIPALDGCL